jgi:peptide deformylase
MIKIGWINRCVTIMCRMSKLLLSGKKKARVEINSPLLNCKEKEEEKSGDGSLVNQSISPDVNRNDKINNHLL